jgi:nitroreductase
MSDSFLSNLDWRFATKKFDTSKKVSDTDLAKILEAVQKAPTSYGLQPYHVYVITNPAVREKMLPLSYNQNQVIEASHILVFCTRTDATERVNDLIEKISNGSEEVKTSLKGYADMMHGSVNSKTEDQILSWNSRQTYIALGFGLAACAELKIDSCPMEGFDSKAIDTLLEIPAHMKSFAYLAIGFRAEDPANPKFRFDQSDLFTKI